MNIIKTKDRINRLDQLIRKEATGSPDELAEKMNVSIRTIFRTIDELKKIGCPISFDKNKNSYCYEFEGKLIFEFEKLDNDELKYIAGGKSYTFLPTDTTCRLPIVSLSRKTKHNLSFYGLSDT